MENRKPIILSSAYLGSVAYFSRFLSSVPVAVEQYDHYTKQTYRNRCVILSANGPLPLVIPVTKNHGRKTFMKDVRIDYATNWQRLHLNGIVSAYRSSAFFEFYFDAFEPYYRRKTTFLLDFDMSLTRIALESLGIAKEISLSSSYASESSGFRDERDWFRPKSVLGVPGFEDKPYVQVFSDRFGFVPGLSIIDLLFNAGPEARGILGAGVQ